MRHTFRILSGQRSGAPRETRVQTQNRSSRKTESSSGQEAFFDTAATATTTTTVVVVVVVELLDPALGPVALQRDEVHTLQGFAPPTANEEPRQKELKDSWRQENSHQPIREF